jgi:arylsulfatase A-like enzyme
MRTLCVSCAFVVLAFTAPSAQTPPRPNVVMVIMDDLGYGDIGSYGVPDAKTPNIDRLAREGVKFTDFYANHANCSPTRTALISGRYQQRYGIESPLGPHDKRYLPPSDASLPRLLKSAGYATGLFGKWHLGVETSSGPNRHGFDEFWGFRRAAVDYYTHTVVTVEAVKLPAPIHDLYHNEEPTTSTAYLTDDITNRAMGFIEQRATQRQPFFVEVAYNATHWPFQRPDLPEGKRGWDHYRESGTRADYVAMLERADQGIGRILDTLDRLKVAGNTLVIFTSDNGGEWLSRNAPLFHRKSTLWEGGIRVPLLLRWPAQLKAGITSRQVGITMDLTSSILAAAAVQAPTIDRPEGVDLIALLRKGTIVERTLYWRMPAALNQPATPPVTQRALRRGDWKYLDDRGQYLLFNLRTDPGERNDLAHQHGDRIREFRSLVAKWETDVDAEAKQRAAQTLTLP